MDDPVQAQLEAYNSRNLEAFISCYSPDVVITKPDGTAVMTGHRELRTQYGAMFGRLEDLHIDVPRRLHAGSWTVDEEHVTSSERTMQALVAYQIADGLIVRVVMFV